MTKSVRLPNGRHWRTQSEARDHFKQILSRSTLGERVTDADDHADLAALLQVYDSVLRPGAARRDPRPGWETRIARSSARSKHTTAAHLMRLAYP